MNQKERELTQLKSFFGEIKRDPPGVVKLGDVQIWMNRPGEIWHRPFSEPRKMGADPLLCPDSYCPYKGHLFSPSGFDPHALHLFDVL